MDVKKEGVVFRPLPVAPQVASQVVRHGVPAVASDIPCEMCAAPVIATHCKRICLRCGFMTGCSEGI